MNRFGTYDHYVDDGYRAFVAGCRLVLMLRYIVGLPLTETDRYSLFNYAWRVL